MKSMLPSQLLKKNKKPLASKAVKQRKQLEDEPAPAKKKAPVKTSPVNTQRNTTLQLPAPEPKKAPKAKVELVPVPAEEAPSDDEIKAALKSHFGQRSDLIIQMLEDSDSDGALTLLQKSLLQSVIGVLPHLEATVIKSKGRFGAHQFNLTVSQLREFLADIQAMRDRGQVGVRVVQQTVQPAFIDIASQLSIAWIELENRAAQKMDVADFQEYRKDVLLPIKTNLATFMRDKFAEVSQAVSQSLS